MTEDQLVDLGEKVRALLPEAFFYTDAFGNLHIDTGITVQDVIEDDR